MALSPLDRPQPPSSARAPECAPRGGSDGIGLQLISMRNGDMASEPLGDLPMVTRTAPVSAPRTTTAPAELQRDGPISCKEALELLMSMKQGQPVKKCLELNSRGHV